MYFNFVLHVGPALAVLTSTLQVSYAFFSTREIVEKCKSVEIWPMGAWAHHVTESGSGLWQ
jgi:hypothetical protein